MLKLFKVEALLVVWIVQVVCACSSNHESNADVNGWHQSQSGYQQSYIDTLRSEVEKGRYININSVVVVRGGELLIEEYFNGGERDEPHDVRSVGKTFASALLGIAIADGYLKSADQTLGDFYQLDQYPNFSEKKKSVTLRNLLTMSSAFDGSDNDPNSIGNEENMYPQENWVEWALGLPMSAHRNPGDSSIYFTAGVVILGDILNKSVPGGLEEYAHEKLFEKLGISNYEWRYTPQDVVSTAGGIRLTPLDLAKFGQLYLSNGKWHGQQIIPADWIDATMTRYYETGYDGNGYGYLMWNKVYDVGGRSFETFYCSGNGGNKIFVFKELDAVVVVTARAYNQRYAHPQVDEMMVKYIIPALLEGK